jgi:hypothetical protein
MTNPNVRHAVCPECHTHQPTLPDGRLTEHQSKPQAGEEAGRCPGSEDWPNRAADTDTAYSTTSQFASCPAATGEARPQCPDFPDGAHRCSLSRDHARASNHLEHSCTCGAVWFSHMGTVNDLVDLMNRKPS